MKNTENPYFFVFKQKNPHQFTCILSPINVLTVTNSNNHQRIREEPHNNFWKRERHWDLIVTSSTTQNPILFFLPIENPSENLQRTSEESPKWYISNSRSIYQFIIISFFIAVILSWSFEITWTLWEYFRCSWSYYGKRFSNWFSHFPDIVSHHNWNSTLRIVELW